MAVFYYTSRTGPGHRDRAGSSWLGRATGPAGQGRAEPAGPSRPNKAGPAGPGQERGRVATVFFHWLCFLFLFLFYFIFIFVFYFYFYFIFIFILFLFCFCAVFAYV